MNNSSRDRRDWHFAKSLAALREKKSLVARIASKQIALFDTPQGVRACDNRCPHEAYPLSEGSLAKDCSLTCNWHNWKFNLDTGENLYGGDRLRIYPVDVRGDEIWIDIADPPFKARYATIVGSLRNAFNDHAYDRIAREIARLTRLGGDPLDALRLAIDWSWQRMEFGWTHAYAGMADWLTLYDEYSDDRESQLVCLVESVAHIAFDVLREREHPFSSATMPFEDAVFLQAIEDEDEPKAIACIRGGLHNGLSFSDFERAFTQAALMHYSDFGHSLIYVSKVGELIARLGRAVSEPLLLSLVRSLIFAPREDKIPKFRAYPLALASWNKPGGRENTLVPSASLWHKRGIDSALQLTAACSAAEPETIYHELLLANAIGMLSFDIDQQDKVHVSVSGNVGWLDFTHGLTFANAVRKQCVRFPAFWPQGLLQMACFCGRNAVFTTADYDLDLWRLDDVERGFAVLLDRVLDHGQGEYIVSVHWLKTVLAVREECRCQLPEKTEVLLAALNRFISSPLKRRQAKRTAYQSLNFVDKE